MAKNFWEGDSDIDENPFELDHLTELELQNNEADEEVSVSTTHQKIDSQQNTSDETPFSDVFFPSAIDVSLFNEENEVSQKSKDEANFFQNDIDINNLDVETIETKKLDFIDFSNGSEIIETIVFALQSKSVKDQWENNVTGIENIDNMTGEELWNFIQMPKKSLYAQKLSNNEYISLRPQAVDAFQNRINLIKERIYSDKSSKLSAEDETALKVSNSTLRSQSDNTLVKKLFGGIWLLCKVPLLPVTLPINILFRSIKFGYGIIEASYNKVTSFFNKQSKGYKIGNNKLTMANALSLALIGSVSYQVYENNLHIDASNYVEGIYNEYLTDVNSLDISVAKNIATQVYNDALDEAHKLVAQLPPDIFQLPSNHNSWENVPHLPSTEFGAKSVTSIVNSSGVSVSKANEIYEHYFQRFQKEYRDCVEGGRSCSMSLSLGRNTVARSGIDTTASIVFNGVDNKFTIYNSDGTILLEEDLKTDAMLDNRLSNLFN